MQFPFDTVEPDLAEQGHAFTILVRVPITATTRLADASQYLRSLTFKQDFQKWLDSKHPNFSFSAGFHAFPIYAVEGDRTSDVTHYGIEMRVLRPM